MTARELLKWRERNKCSQGILALILEVDIVTISRWERGVQKIPPYLKYALRYIEEQGDMVIESIDRRKEQRRKERERRKKQADPAVLAENKRSSSRRKTKRRNED